VAKQRRLAQMELDKQNPGGQTGGIVVARYLAQ
jgi:hypothetical protein